MDKRAICESLRKIKRANPLGVSNRVVVDNIELLIQMGLAAGDHSRPYVTDKGDSYLEDPDKVELSDAIKNL